MNNKRNMPLPEDKNIVLDQEKSNLAETKDKDF